MSDRRTDAVPRRPRIGLVAVFVVIALIAGIALMFYAVRSSGGWLAAPAARPEQQQPNTYNPTPPQSAVATAQPVIDPAILATRESALAAQIAALEARTAVVSIDASAASGQAARAEAMLIAFAVRRAIERGMALGYLEEQMRLRFGTVQPRSVAIILRASRDPLTVATLRQGLDANAGDLTAGGDGDLLASLIRELRTLVVIHDAGTPSPIPGERIERARRLLDAGQVAAALAEVKRLPGAGSAGAWIAAAGRYVETRHALDAIEAAALLGQATGAPIPATPTNAPFVPAVAPVTAPGTPSP